MHTLDTNAVIYYLNGELSAVHILDGVFDKAADSAIAATALLTHTTLITRNIRDFQQIDTLQLLEI